MHHGETEGIENSRFVGGKGWEDPTFSAGEQHTESEQTEKVLLTENQILLIFLVNIAAAKSGT